MRRIKPMRYIQSPECGSVILSIQSSRIFDWLREKGRGAPERLGIKQFRSIIPEVNIHWRTCIYQPARTKTQSKTSSSYGECFIVRQVRDNIQERKL